ncbi:MAG: hypothetical protein KF859_03870 [Phycisphaeraceae bacterium]|nr:hypothetical protein [Phycisphaeraceae bacterium]
MPDHEPVKPSNQDEIYDLEPAPPETVPQGARTSTPADTSHVNDIPVGTPARVVKSAPAFIKPGLGNAQVVSLVGAGITLSAVIVAALYAGQRGERWAPAAVSTLYSALLHATTGVVAIMIVAAANRLRAGDLILACSRMLVAVSVFLLVSNVELPLPDRIGETTLACAVYIAVIWAFFRWRPDVVGTVAAVHATIWFFLHAASIIHVWRLTPAG